MNRGICQKGQWHWQSWWALRLDWFSAAFSFPPSTLPKTHTLLWSPEEFLSSGQPPNPAPWDPLPPGSHISPSCAGQTTPHEHASTWQIELLLGLSLWGPALTMDKILGCSVRAHLVLVWVIESCQSFIGCCDFCLFSTPALFRWKDCVYCVGEWISSMEQLWQYFSVSPKSAIPNPDYFRQ